MGNVGEAVRINMMAFNEFVEKKLYIEFEEGCVEFLVLKEVGLESNDLSYDYIHTYRII